MDKLILVMMFACLNFYFHKKGDLALYGDPIKEASKIMEVTI